MLPAEPTLISLFSGAGGLDIGLETAGFRCVTATDASSDCFETLLRSQAARIRVPDSGGRFYLEGTRVLGAPIEELRSSDLVPADVESGWRPDLLAGGPPCQPFSSSGKQLALEDPRGRLFEHFVRIARGLRPRYILFENVRGLVTARGPRGEPGEALLMVRRAFEKIGYSTKFALLNAADFGVPQRRVRLFMIGTQEGPMPEFPAPTHHDGRGHAAGRSPWVSLREHLAKCPEPSEDEIVEPTDALANRLREIPDGSGLRSPGARERTRPGGHWGYRQGTFVADLDRPARTVTASPTQDWVRVGGTTRRLTERECAGLQGFPAAWVFCGGKSSRFRQIGNAVPARLGDVLGACICDALSRSPETVQPVSEPFPEAFSAAIAYTLREEKSNGPSRMSVRRLQAAGRVEQSRIKGTGSHDRRRSHR